MKRIDFFLGVVIIAISIMVAGFVSRPEIMISQSGVGVLRAGGREIIPVELVRVNLSYFNPVPVKIVNP